MQRPPLLLRAHQERPGRHSLLLLLLSKPERAALCQTGHLLGWQHGRHGALLQQHQLL
jgi:hypothetical protein